MKTRICDKVGIDFPLFAFSHCRDVVAAVSKAGGFGVLGAVGFTPEQLEIELNWVDAHIDGKPYGVDLAIPENMAVKSEVGLTSNAIWERIPANYHSFVEDFLVMAGVDPKASSWEEDREVGLMHDTAERAMDVVFKHPVRLVVQALGLAPQSMIDRGRASDVPIGALIGSPEHANRQVELGVDVLIAQGTEAGGHCGEISTLVLVPEVVRSVDLQRTSVLAAGGIVTGQQMAAAMAMGADGAWTGSVWLPTVESDVSDVVRNKLIAARSRDTLRTRASTGKMCRQLRSTWTSAWEGDGSLEPLPMPLQPILSGYAMSRLTRAAETGNVKAAEAVNHLVGQGVGMLDRSRTARSVVEEFMADFLQAVERMRDLTDV